MNYIRSLYHRSAVLLLSLSDLDNLHRKIPILPPSLTRATRLLKLWEKSVKREELIFSIRTIHINITNASLFLLQHYFTILPP